jgi:hypothetical protein
MSKVNEAILLSEIEEQKSIIDELVKVFKNYRDQKGEFDPRGYIVHRRGTAVAFHSDYFIGMNNVLNSEKFKAYREKE